MITEPGQRYSPSRFRDHEMPAWPLVSARRLGPVSRVANGHADVSRYGQCDSAGGVRTWDYSDYSQPGWPATAAGQALFDPLWGTDDPAAGAWFSQQALQLAQEANPPLRPFFTAAARHLLAVHLSRLGQGKLGLRSMVASRSAALSPA